MYIWSQIRRVCSLFRDSYHKVEAGVILKAIIHAIAIYLMKILSDVSRDHHMGFFSNTFAPFLLHFETFITLIR